MRRVVTRREARRAGFGNEGNGAGPAMSGFSVNERFRRHYDEYYSDGDFGYKRLSRLDTTANVRELCADIAHGRVLEIGCGDGILLELLSEEGEGFVDELWGVEIAESAVEATKRRKIPKLRECSMFDGYTLKYEDDYFDLAVMSHVLEHVEYPRRLLYESSLWRCRWSSRYAPRRIRLATRGTSITIRRASGGWCRVVVSKWYGR